MKDMVQIRRGSTKNYDAPDVRIGRSQFNRSCGLKTTFDASYVYPMFLDDVLPGDTFTMSVNGFARIFSPFFVATFLISSLPGVCRSTFSRFAMGPDCLHSASCARMILSFLARYSLRYYRCLRP